MPLNLPYMRLIYRAWRYRLRLDPEEIAFLRQTVKPGQLVVDIGAHKGAYSYWLSKAVGPAGRVVAFEPQPLLADGLNRLAIPRVTIENMALSSTSGKMTLSIPGSAPSPGATLEQRDQPGMDHYQVQVATLDEYFDAGSDPVAFMKIDVEGHELELFKGGQQLIERHHPILLFECEQKHHTSTTVSDVFDWLLARGYEGHFFMGSTKIPVSEFDPVRMQSGVGLYINNFIFRPAS